ncbi:MAG: ABC transporter permease [Thaumarchaeota archaeon]|nr:ABC transporter permease [Nitrososphaerota archaeon]
MSRPEGGAMTRLAYGVGGFLVFFAIWEVVADFVVRNPLFLPSFSSVVVAAATDTDYGALTSALSVTLRNFGIGMVIASALAIPTGFVFGWYRRVRQVFSPLLSALYAAPLIAIMPAIIVLFGVFDVSKVILVVLAAFFPLAINVESGVRNIDAYMVEMARSFGATDRQIFRTIAFRAAVPYTLAGLRLAIGRGLVFIIIAEMFASTNGIGYIISTYADTFQMTKMFVPVFLVVLIAVILIAAVQLFEARVQGWKPSNH